MRRNGGRGLGSEGKVVEEVGWGGGGWRGIDGIRLMVLMWDCGFIDAFARSGACE